MGGGAGGPPAFFWGWNKESSESYSWDRQNGRQGRPGEGSQEKIELAGWKKWKGTCLWPDSGMEEGNWIRWNHGWADEFCKRTNRGVHACTHTHPNTASPLLHQIHTIAGTGLSIQWAPSLRVQVCFWFYFSTLIPILASDASPRQANLKKQTKKKRSRWLVNALTVLTPGCAVTKPATELLSRHLI